LLIPWIGVTVHRSAKENGLPRNLKFYHSLLERISRSGKFGIEDSDASPAWKNCPNKELTLAHIQSVWNDQQRFIAGGERQWFLNQSMVMLLNIGGNRSCLGSGTNLVMPTRRTRL
jgi:hypothetical protein